MSDADFAALGDLPFEAVDDLYLFCREGRNISAASSLVVVQAAHDLKRACLAIPTINGRPNAKANRVSRPLRRAGLHLYAVQRCFAVLPRVFLATYAEEIAAMRQRTNGRAGIDLRKV